MNNKINYNNATNEELQKELMIRELKRQKWVKTKNIICIVLIILFLIFAAYQINIIFTSI